ncbi:MAG: glycoside hydrolase family 2 protein [Spirochaetales bacterium]|nr:glycoside hydrolase family 2 protein [Spirochaetales bacterium]
MTTYIPLNFDWKYIPDFKDEYLKEEFNEEGFSKVNLPHTNMELPYNNFDEKLSQFESCYRKNFTPPEKEAAKRLYLCFEGVMSSTRIYVNGLFVSGHKGGYTPFKTDITESVRFGEENLIAVYVDSRERPEIPPFGFVIDYLTYGGIYREVHLEYRAEVSIDNCKIVTSNLSHSHKTIDLLLYLKNQSRRKGTVSASFKVLKTCCNRDESQRSILPDASGAPGAFDELSGKLAGTHEINFELTSESQQVVAASFEVEDAELWDLDNPNLYNLAVQLVDADVFDHKSFRFGFRKVEFRNDGFFLNGNRIKIRGLNRHQSYPYVGYAMPRSAQYRDAEILKYELGLNTVRLSHYPQSRHFLDRCDELGLLVFDEIPGWQHIGEPGEWQDITLQHVEEMITTDWNRPSIFIWGVRINESRDCDELYEKTNRLARGLDSTRPTGGVRCIPGSNLLEDVYTYNDFNHNGKRPPLLKRKKVVRKSVPYLITEHNGHMFPTKKFDHVSRRVEQALRHGRILDAMYGDDEVAGAIGWCMFDYNTHKEFGSGDKICYHGVQDIFRIPKYAAAVYASQSDILPVMEVAHSLANGDVDESIRGDIYIFTNCDYVKMYINGE